jgi:hypothetical protein
MCLVFCYQKHLSLRTQVVNPLVLVFMVLASTAALVSTHTEPMKQQLQQIGCLYISD